MHNDAHLCMVGPDKDGSMEQVEKLVDELNLTGSVSFTGKLSKSDWVSLSKEYDIFINTTNFDNHPVSVIESMALGLPVVSTNVGGIPFLIKNNIDGLLVPPKDVSMFVKGVNQYISNPDIAKNISLTARKKAEGFSWQEVKFKWHEVINSAIPQ
jgi:glycosyltransferase involved in cell wall biosynthesis